MDKSRFFVWTGLFLGIKSLWITRAFLVDKAVNRGVDKWKTFVRGKVEFIKIKYFMNKNNIRKSYPQKLFTLWIKLSSCCGQAGKRREEAFFERMKENFFR